MNSRCKRFTFFERRQTLEKPWFPVVSRWIELETVTGAVAADKAPKAELYQASGDVGAGKTHSLLEVAARRSRDRPGVESRQGPAGTLMKIREIIKLLTDDGWFQVAQKGSHRQFKHETKLGRVTVAGKPNDDLAPATENSILRQAGLKE